MNRQLWQVKIYSCYEAGINQAITTHAQVGNRVHRHRWVLVYGKLVMLGGMERRVQTCGLAGESDQYTLSTSSPRSRRVDDERCRLPAELQDVPKKAHQELPLGRDSILKHISQRSKPKLWYNNAHTPDLFLWSCKHRPAADWCKCWHSTDFTISAKIELGGLWLLVASVDSDREALLA